MTTTEAYFIQHQIHGNSWLMLPYLSCKKPQLPSLEVDDSVVKNPPAMQETQIQSLGHKRFLEEEMATHSSILAWEIQWTEEPGGLYSPWGCKSRTWLSN